MIAPLPLHASALEAPKRILVVDDDEDSRVIYAAFLATAGYETTLAASALEAFRLARTSPPAAVLLDLVLPDVHGSELVRMFQDTPGLESVPFIGITARVTQALINDPGSVNLSRLLIKPTTSAQLLDALRSSIAGG